jgi:GNAT superfamily N-acetyltransferase
MIDVSHAKVSEINRQKREADQERTKTEDLEVVKGDESPEERLSRLKTAEDSDHGSLLTPRPVKIHVTVDGHVSVSMKDGMLSVACAEMDDMGEYWWIARVFVREKFRRKGFGSRVVRELQERAGDKPIVVCPGGYGTPYKVHDAFYKSCGFRETEDKGELTWSL